MISLLQRYRLGIKLGEEMSVDYLFILEIQTNKHCRLQVLFLKTRKDAARRDSGG